MRRSRATAAHANSRFSVGHAVVAEDDELMERVVIAGTDIGHLEGPVYRCVLCSFVSLTGEGLKRHQRTRHYGAFRCYGCKKKFDSHEAIRKHSKATAHAISRVFARRVVGRGLTCNINYVQPKPQPEPGSESAIDFMS